MINIIKAILEDAEPVTNQGQYESDEEFKDKGTVSKYKDFTDKVGELKENLYDMTDKIKSSKAYESYPVHKVHYGSIDNNKHDDIDLNNLSKYSKLSSVTDEMLGKLFDVTLSTRLVLDLLNKNIDIIDNIGDHVWESKDKLSDSDFNGARNLVYIYGIKCQELINVVKNSKMSDSDKIFNEAASTDEDVAKYVSELNKLIPEIRDYYDKFQYKELVTPRKKHQEKMESYMRGALRRKYDLRIPIYKIEDPTKDVKHMIRSKFIPAIKSIVNKYPNYQLIVPNFNNEDSDMFIYITLKEPFGDDGDRTDRKEQTTEIKEKKKDIINECSFDYSYDDVNILEEAALTKEERNNLPASDYGIPSLKAYPINDKGHIQKAIQLFSHAKPKNKKQLAKNIADKIIELKLVGKIKVNPKNPNAEYFPKWLATDSDAKCEYNTDGTYLLTFKTESKLGRNMYHKEETTGKVKSAVMQESGIKVII